MQITLVFSCDQNLRFREFNETMQTLGVLDFNTKLSSAGLVYAHYGKQLIAEVSISYFSSILFWLTLTHS